MSAALGSPFDVTGAARTTSGDTVIRIEGFEGSVGYRAEQLQMHLKDFGAATVDLDAAKIWQGIRDVTAFAKEKGDVWRISTRPSHAADLAAKIGATQLQFDWGGGLIWALVPEGTDVRATLGNFQGHATLVRASQDTRAAIAPFHPEPAPLAALSNGLRAKFDPRGILNSGLMT
jgi:glycolate oxidase FAD binding subunit